MYGKLRAKLIYEGSLTGCNYEQEVVFKDKNELERALEVWLERHTSNYVHIVMNDELRRLEIRQIMKVENNIHEIHELKGIQEI